MSDDSHKRARPGRRNLYLIILIILVLVGILYVAKRALEPAMQEVPVPSSLDEDDDELRGRAPEYPPMLPGPEVSTITEEDDEFGDEFEGQIENNTEQPDEAGGDTSSVDEDDDEE